MKHGYIVVPGVLSSEEIRKLREIVTVKFQEFSRPGVKKRLLWPSEIMQCEDIYKHYFNSRIVDCLKQIFGASPEYLADFQVQKDNFGAKAYRDGWHYDANSEGFSEYLTKKSYSFVKCGLYLQNNTPEWGGGIDIVAKGHRFPLPIGSARSQLRLKNLFNRIGQRYWPISLDIKAGDFVAFDSRLPHNSTFASKISDNSQTLTPPLEFSKIVLYWDAGFGPAVKEFLSNSIKRRKQEQETQASEHYFSDYLRYSYPNDFPQVLKSLVENQKIGMATPDSEMAQEFRKNCHQAFLQFSELDRTESSGSAIQNLAHMNSGKLQAEWVSIPPKTEAPDRKSHNAF